MKKILFITGTRADYGKIKALIKSVEETDCFEPYIYVSGMHLLENYGSTYHEILKDHYKNVYVNYGQVYTGNMSYDLGNTICQLTGYMLNVKPDLVIIHGDRIDALAGAVVGALNNIKVAHIEGGELSGTIDESIRHAISKFAHVHLVCNEEAKHRLLQLGEEEERITVIGSPDIDIMLSPSLPSLSKVRERYDINFRNYAVFMYHPVTTEFADIRKKISAVVDALIASQHNYIVIFPNNDLGSEIILHEYKRFEGSKNFLTFPSIRFEYFLTLLKNAEFMIGNSSAGIRETSVYGIPTIDIGSRQANRYALSSDTNIQHVSENREQILEAIGDVKNYRHKSLDFGTGKSAEHFIELLKGSEIWNFEIQKKFIDIEML